MTEIFKYFVGIIGVLILVYVLLVVLRTVLSSGVSTGANIISDPAVQKNIASGTVDAINGFGQFSLANWLRNFRPFDYAPIEVRVADKLEPKYYNGNLQNYAGWRDQSNLNWQNLNEAPDSHPTDFVPIGDYYYNQLNGGSEGGQEKIENLEPSDRYIRPNLKPRSIVENSQAITGLAYYKVFSQRKFPIYILDEQGNTVGEVVAFANGDMKKDETAPFRAVINLDNIPVHRGFLMFKNENIEMSKIKAVTVVPVLFAK